MSSTYLVVATLVSTKEGAEPIIPKILELIVESSNLLIAIYHLETCLVNLISDKYETVMVRRFITRGHYTLTAEISLKNTQRAEKYELVYDIHAGGNNER